MKSISDHKKQLEKENEELVSVVEKSNKNKKAQQSSEQAFKQ